MRPENGSGRAAAPGRTSVEAPAADACEGDGTDNRSIAEHLSRASAHAEGNARKAMRRAARAAFLWPVEARDVLAEGRSLTELRAIGPYLARVVGDWIESEPEPPEPPPVRRGFLTLVQARRLLARDPDLAAAVRGDLQTHSTWSDGNASLADMALAARELGREYVAATDHSKGLRIAGGIDEGELERQREEIDALNARGEGARILRSMETNLSPAGEVDMDPAALARLDVVLGAFHSALRRTDDQTERYLAGLRNPSIQVLAHPRCRVYDWRLGLSADWRRVFDEAARLDKAVEVDACADRQDLDLALVETARAAGCRISLGTDAHGVGELGVLELGIAAVVAAGIPRERILNAMSADEVAAWAASVRERG